MADLLQRYADWTPERYAQTLWHHHTITPVEPALKQALLQQFARQGITNQLAAQLSGQVCQQRVLQTATHLTLSEGPTFAAVHQMALAGLPQDQPYVAAVFSAIPFSNNAWPGCLNYGARLNLDQLIAPQYPKFSSLLKSEKDRRRDTNDLRLPLIPGSLREALVYQSPMPAEIHKLFSSLNPKLQQWLSSPEPDDTFANWAMQACQSLNRKLFDQPNFWMIDLNQWISDYLLELLENQPDHAMLTLLFNVELRQRLEALSGLPVDWFVCPGLKKNKPVLLKTQLQGDQIQVGDQLLPFQREWLHQQLTSQRLCPALWTCFLPLVFMNGFQCIGSFDQIEYLPQMREAVKQHPLFESSRLETVSTNAFSCGRWQSEDGDWLFPLDVLLGNHPLPALKPTLLETLQPLLQRWISV